jgi:hypothetical protein
VVGLEGLGKLKKSNDLIGNRNRDLPACSIVPQPITLPRAQIKPINKENIRTAAMLLFYILQKNYFNTVACVLDMSL